MTSKGSTGGMQKGQAHMTRPGAPPLSPGGKFCFLGSLGSPIGVWLLARWLEAFLGLGLLPSGCTCLFCGMGLRHWDSVSGTVKWGQLALLFGGKVPCFWVSVFLFSKGQGNVFRWVCESGLNNKTQVKDRGEKHKI